MLKINRERVVRFAKQNKNKELYLYGAGVFGRFCLYLLSGVSILPKAYLVSGKYKDAMFSGLPVYSIHEIKDWSDIAVIITVHKECFQKEIVKNIKRRGVDNYLMFWDDKGNSQELGSVR